MRVFVTGATGFVGSAVVQELMAAGHQVLGLVRSDASAKLLSATGAEVHRGDIEDLDSLRSGVAVADAVIHTAFNHDFSKYQANCETDRRVITAMADVLIGSDRPLIITSGTGLLAGNGLVATEELMPPAASAAMPRVASEEAATAAMERGVRALVLRLPPSVHGDGDHGFIPALIGIARQKGVAAYVGEGLNRWPAVHRLDAARLYRLALEQGTGIGRYHAVDDQGIAMRDIAAIIGKHLNIPVVSKSPQEAAKHFGWIAHFAGFDNPSSSALTRQWLGWQPTQPGLIADLDRSQYFEI
ncbi:SDR family oxidoreductase [Mucilaginibacter rigui]|uniref:SDR family oxidoreductase n=1 Tax=Mucilaginibacter rigui TaxID=534635 RepID=A0ABR7X127_9SPHI|nr:SDR family oxidoreductase [Mucilaginibacter rigui]MBD1384284.1 SDR family oxidoreductase [Mucilaginibacter rigui]